MRRWIGRLLVPLLIGLTWAPASAAETRQIIPILINPDIKIATPSPVPVAFSAVANRYQGVDPATVFDLNGDLVGDIKVSGSQLLAQNGAQVQLVQPAALNLDQVQIVPGGGYSTSAPLQLSRVYVVKLAAGGYAKLMILQASPKVTISFHYGLPTTSVLKANGESSHAVLTWDPLADATLGYNIYRYEVDADSYTVTQLNDFTVQATTFTDNTAANSYHLFAVQAIKTDGSPGAQTTVAAVFVQNLQRSLVVALTPGTAKLDGAAVPVAVKPVIKNGWMMVPASLLTNATVKVVLDAPAGKLTLARHIGSVTYTVVMTLDTSDYTWNGTTYPTDVPPYKAGNEVMVPLRVVAPILGLGLTFNSVDRTATIQWSE